MNAIASAVRQQVTEDPLAFYEYSLAQGWGDGLPVFHPTDDRVEALLARTTYAPGDVVAQLPPKFGVATAELIAVNAAMAGVEPEAFPHVVAAIEAISDPDWNAFGLTRTTSSVCPMIIANGPSLDRLGIDYRDACLGGAAGRGSMTIGRAVQLCLRNIGGQKAGDTTRSVFGQPARSSGLCFGEWVAESPWPTLAERRGFAGDADVVTVHGGKGIMPVADLYNDDPGDLLYMLAKSLAFPMNQAFLGGHGEVVMVVNPIWAQRLAVAYPTVPQLQEAFQEMCWHPVENFPAANQVELHKTGRVDSRGRVNVFHQPGQIVPVVCGGLGSLHTLFFTCFGSTIMQSREVKRRQPVSPR